MGPFVNPGVSDMAWSLGFDANESYFCDISKHVGTAGYA
jgi:hypothetical protein